MARLVPFWNGWMFTTEAIISFSGTGAREQLRNTYGSAVSQFAFAQKYHEDRKGDESVDTAAESTSLPEDFSTNVRGAASIPPVLLETASRALPAARGRDLLRMCREIPRRSTEPN